MGRNTLSVNPPPHKMVEQIQIIRQQIAEESFECV